MRKLKRLASLLLMGVLSFAAQAMGQTTYHYGAKEATNVWQGNNQFLNALNYLVDTGSTNTYVVTTLSGIPPYAFTYIAGEHFWIKAANGNTGPATLNVNAVGAKAITKQGTVPLVGTEITAGSIFEVVYDGTQFQMVAGGSGGGGGGGGSGLSAVALQMEGVLYNTVVTNSPVNLGNQPGPLKPQLLPVPAGYAFLGPRQAVPGIAAVVQSAVPVAVNGSPNVNSIAISFVGATNAGDDIIFCTTCFGFNTNTPNMVISDTQGNTFSAGVGDGPEWQSLATNIAGGVDTVSATFTYPGGVSCPKMMAEIIEVTNLTGAVDAHHGDQLVLSAGTLSNDITSSTAYDLLMFQTGVDNTTFSTINAVPPVMTIDGELSSVSITSSAIYADSFTTFPGLYTVTINSPGSNASSFWVAYKTGGTFNYSLPPNWRPIAPSDLPNGTALNPFIVYNNISNTYVGGDQNFTSASKLEVPQGTTTGTNGQLAYDGFHNFFHAYVAGGDAILVTRPDSPDPTNGDCVQWYNSGGIIELHDSGSAGCGSGASLTFQNLTPNSVLTTFTLSAAPPNNAALVFWNGLARDTTQYSITGTTLTTSFTALTGDSLLVVWPTGSGGGGGGGTPGGTGSQLQYRGGASTFNGIAGTQVDSNGNVVFASSGAATSWTDTACNAVLTAFCFDTGTTAGKGWIAITGDQTSSIKLDSSGNVNLKALETSSHISLLSQTITEAQNSAGGTYSLTSDTISVTGAATFNGHVYVPTGSSAVGATNGEIIYNTTGKNYHGFDNAADSIFVSAVASLNPGNNDCPVWINSGGHIALGDLGTPCPGGSGGGNVSNSGSPSAHGIAVWVTSTTIKSVGPTVGVLHGFSSADPSFSLVENADLDTSIIATANIQSNAVNSSKLAVVNTYKTCDIVVGDASSSSSLSTGQLGPQRRICYIPAASTIVELDVNSDSATPSIIVGKNHNGSVSNIVSTALATAGSGGIACSNTGGTTGLNGVTTCSATLQNTSIAAGDYLELVSGTPSTAKSMAIHIIYTTN